MKRGILISNVCFMLLLATSLLFSSCTGKAITPAPKPTPALTPSPVGAPTPTAKPAPEVRKMEVTMVDWQNPGHFFIPPFETFAKQVTERTGGRLTVKLVKATVIGLKWDDILRSLKEGSTHMSTNATFYLDGQNPLWGLGWIPLFVENIKEMSLVTHAVRDIFQAEFNKFGVQMLSHWPYDEQVPTSTVPINKVADFKALRIRSTGAPFAELLQALGATPVTMPIADVYTSAQRGLINAYSVGWDTHRIFSDWEVFKYVLDFSFNTGSQVLLMSKSLYDSLPGDLKAIVLEEAERLSDAEYMAAVAATSRGRQALKEKGMTFITPDEGFKAEVRSLARGVLENWSKKSPASAEALKQIKTAVGR